MLFRCLCLFFLLQSAVMQAQTPVLIADQTLKLDGLHDYHYALAEGDRLSLYVQLIAGRQLRACELIRFPDEVILRSYNLDTVLRKEIVVPKTGIYTLRLQENGLGKKICRFVLNRTPAGSATARMDTRVGWDLKKYPQFEVRTRAVPAGVRTEVHPQNGKVNVPAGRFGIQKAVGSYQFTLPPNTVRWAYRLSVGQAGADARRQDAAKYSAFLQKGATTVLKYQPESALAAFALGVAIDLTVSYAGEAVEYALLTPDNLPKFEKRAKYDAYLWQGGVSVDVQRRYTPLSGTYFFALRNPNWIDPIDVSIDIEAVTETPLTAEEIYVEPVVP
jgi:hypothetical protein